MSYVQNELAHVQGESLKASLRAVFLVVKFWMANSLYKEKDHDPNLNTPPSRPLENPNPKRWRRSSPNQTPAS